ncbi:MULTISPECIES: quinoprotein dehydrogenase-associated putative ABC transporter substrate-binding protein [Methylosinus]|uniref:Quinoprotein dehydrogenase-associated putative ABC transporter substrate-binding protein n=1 Tax=Methylosinus trichosporium (strain ATCC 35070 / NCIMB 11131 / UNIQEM 75 / OB3b) TaxID=595536 RepID=A0A2D2D2V2_METT3|nr:MULTISPECIES: quinoprotein dehydrogenase-associated putative ABC transporter substrate-binding protein [Methylosinus]ATQ69189.1 quinoprotein dehydrogenase-associated putative ABC transporter substrate-binding protein [Methylosinus trichosporium OB3b]OBS53612.1 hypothetical protein A8B73_05300 [Methylosinus sp. 3S-1]
MPGFLSHLLTVAALSSATLAFAQQTPANAPRRAFLVCADPANPPYSSKDRDGFENKIAAVLAADMTVDVDFFWFAGHKSFLRRTLLEGMCDAVVAIPEGLPATVTTRPYFASSFVAVTRSADTRRFVSFDDEWLREARIGLPLVGNEGATTPPALSLSTRGFTEHITPFPMWAEDGASQPPQGRIIDAVAAGEIDVAFVWGPVAGFFARKHGGALRIEPITHDPRRPEVAFVFPMAVGVRKADVALRDRLQRALDAHTVEIAAILRESGVPLVAAAPEKVKP